MATTTTTTTPAALTSIDDDSIIKNRLLTRTTVTRGEPPLKKLKRKFNNFCSEVKKGSSNDVEAAAKTFLHEFNSYILPLSKAKAIIDAQLREEECFKKLQEELTSQISQVEIELEQLNKDMESAQKKRLRLEEYEKVKDIIVSQPSRQETQASIEELEKEITQLEEDDKQLGNVVELKSNQFKFFLNTVTMLEEGFDPKKVNFNEPKKGKEFQPQDNGLGENLL